MHITTYYRKTIHEIFKEACAAFAPAPLLGPNTIKNMIEEIEITFNKIYPETVKTIIHQLGFMEGKSLELPLEIPPVERIHYREELPKQTIQQQNIFEKSISKILPQSMKLHHTVKIHVKKPHKSHHPKNE